MQNLFRAPTPESRLERAWGADWVKVLERQRCVPGAAGWYVDLEFRSMLRWWSGEDWTAARVWADAGPLAVPPQRKRLDKPSRWGNEFWATCDVDEVLASASGHAYGHAHRDESAGL